MARLSRSLMIAAAMLATLAACSKSGASLGAPGPEDMTMGNPNAKVLVAEYASVGCPVCEEACPGSAVNAAARARWDRATARSLNRALESWN